MGSCVEQVAGIWISFVIMHCFKDSDSRSCFGSYSFGGVENSTLSGFPIGDGLARFVHSEKNVFTILFEPIVRKSVVCLFQEYVKFCSCVFVRCNFFNLSAHVYICYTISECGSV